MSSTESPDELYGVSWSNPALSHFLCSSNVVDYFCNLSNPFYDRQCNNEVIRMQRLSPEQLLCMTGMEYCLDHFQEPILFVIRKQQRLSSTQVTPLAYYYVINGTVLQAPDLTTLLNSRILTTVTGLKKVLQTLAPCARYHPSDGSYSWDDPDTLLGLNSDTDSNLLKGLNNQKSDAKSNQSKPPNLFQVQRTDALLADWRMRFPLPVTPTPSTTQTPAVSGTNLAAHTTGTPNIPGSAPSMHPTFKEEPPSHVLNSPAKTPIKSQTLPGVSVEKRPRI